MGIAIAGIAPARNNPERTQTVSKVTRILRKGWPDLLAAWLSQYRNENGRGKLCRGH
jgi:hypothetical protein